MENRLNEIEETLSSLDSVEKIELKPFFYTRLKSKMASQSRTAKVHVRVSWAVLVLVLIVNAIALLSFNKFESNNVSTDQVLSLKEEYYSQTDDLYTLIEEYETE